ncbi:MAG: 4-hydroxy-tetrahydrodipicolinate reductase [Firmicutes bacterium]|nr:4-hydroxy-tetrahydrodipicolinate reductase [Bacillota bacterium]
MKVMIAGYGRMGQLIEKTLLAENAADGASGQAAGQAAGSAANLVTARIDVAADSARGISDASALASMDKVADLIMDFSHPTLTDELRAYAWRTATPLLSGTTNLTPAQMDDLQALGEKVPVIWSSNYSFGINLFRHILGEIAPVLEGWDVEVTETHHNRKVDAPSGTAKTLIQAIDPKGECDLVHGREGNCGARTKKEIGVHSLRGGTVVGEHRVDFYGTDEVFEITHKMGSRQILVDGAIAAGKKLLLRQPGFYTMDDLLFG